MADDAVLKKNNKQVPEGGRPFSLYRESSNIKLQAFPSPESAQVLSAGTTTALHEFWQTNTPYRIAMLKQQPRRFTSGL